MGLDDAIGLVRNMLCQDPRDRVYGILSMVEWANKVPIQPDYSKNRTDVGRQVLEALVVHGVDPLITMSCAVRLRETLELEPDEYQQLARLF